MCKKPLLQVWDELYILKGTLQMLGKTHFAVGMASALAILQPQTLPVLLTGTAAAAVGGMISDIDCGTSQAHQGADKIMTAAIAVTSIVIFIDYRFHLGVYERLMQNSSVSRLLTGLMAFVMICAYGSRQPHRSFMHSFPAMIMLTACMDVIYPDAAPYFGVGFLSHLLLDVFNFRQEKLFWPMKKGFCLRLCSSQGTVNRILLIAGNAATILLVLTSVPIRRFASLILAFLFP